jgi:phage gpG-like protein
MQLRMSLQGEVQLSRNLQFLSDAVQDWTPAFEQSGEDLVEFFGYDVFESQGEAIDEPWQELSPAYAKQKERRFPGTGILEATGAMRDSFMQAADSTSLRVWNAMEYFKFHQSNQPRTRMPRRAMMRLTQQLRELVIKNFQTLFVEKLNGAS